MATLELNANSELIGLDRLINHYSDLDRLKRGAYWILDFGRHCWKRPRAAKGSEHHMTKEDLDYMEIHLVKYEQQRCLNQVYSSLLKGKSLNRSNCPVTILKGSPTLVNGVIRMKGRLSKASVAFATRCPVLLPFDSHVSRLIVDKYHRRCGHGSIRYTFSYVREGFWLQKSSSLIKRVIKSCLKCTKSNAKCEQQLMADLPDARLQIFEPPFAHSGVDYFGPYLVKQGRSTIKRYGCVFTCFDNGANFVGAARVLKEDVEKLNKNKINKEAQRLGIEWSFNPPSASHFGGVWERVIRTIKKIMKSLSPGPLYTDDVLRSVLRGKKAL